MTHKESIENRLEAMYQENHRLIQSLGDPISLLTYQHLTRECDGKRIWTQALQTALKEHPCILIPASDEPYYIDAPILVPSNRHIEASPDATIRLLEGITTLMLRNEHTLDGSHQPIPRENEDFNISINGGRWEEYYRSRAGYGKSGMYDPAYSLPGVTTCLLFNHLEHLTLSNMVFAHTASFSVQVGDVRSAVFENITFESCYADGLHINGNSEDLLIRSIRGEVGDDLVALNTYDWQNSSVDFGPGRYILCEDLELAPSSRYKSLRIEPGVYTYDDGTQVDCSLTDTIIRRVKGIHTFKMYFQTPAYAIGSEPEPGQVGSAGHIYFEDIDIDLFEPIDKFEAYLESDPLRGAFASFELGANIDYISFENIRLTLHRDVYPLSYLITVGPKSIRNGCMEVFDPYISNHVDCIELKDIFINGQRIQNAGEYIHVTQFSNINQDGHSTAQGTIGKILL